MSKVTTEATEVTYKVEFTNEEMAEVVFLLGRVYASQAPTNSFELFLPLSEAYREHNDKQPYEEYELHDATGPVQSLAIVKKDN